MQEFPGRLSPWVAHMLPEALDSHPSFQVLKKKILKYSLASLVLNQLDTLWLSLYCSL